MLYDANVATKFADEMLKKGIYVIGFSFPVRIDLGFVWCRDHRPS